jgi:hypothetical protein
MEVLVKGMDAIERIVRKHTDTLEEKEGKDGEKE